MLRILWRLFRLLLLLLVVGLGLYLGGPFLLTALGRYLITETPPAKADLALVLGGEPFLRVPEAARLYHEALAPRILLTNPARPLGQEELLRVGLRYPDEQELAVKLLGDLRVPREAILTLPDRAAGTAAEAAAVAAFVRARRARTVIVVTSKAHTTRAQKLLARRLGPGVRLLMHPVRSDPFDPTRWWHTREGLLQVTHEYQALLLFWCERLWEGIWGEVTAVPPRITVR
jgi:uncharacterized SAM-binding protein YcdF (DUF218 family)